MDEFIWLIVGVLGKEALLQHIAEAEADGSATRNATTSGQTLQGPAAPDLEPDPVEHIRLVVVVAPGHAACLRDNHCTLHRFQRKTLVTSAQITPCRWPSRTARRGPGADC